MLFKNIYHFGKLVLRGDKMFSSRLRFLRERNGLLQKEAAEKLNIGQVTYNRYEKGEREPDINTLKKLAEFFNVTTDYLLGNDIETAKQEITDAVSDDPELRAFWDELKEREDLQILCKQTKSLSPSTIKRVIKYIKMVEDEEALEDN